MNITSSPGASPTSASFRVSPVTTSGSAKSGASVPSGSICDSTLIPFKVKGPRRIRSSRSMQGGTWGAIPPEGGPDGKGGWDRDGRGSVYPEDAAGDVGVHDVARRAGGSPDARVPGGLDEARLPAAMHRRSARDAS